MVMCIGPGCVWVVQLRIECDDSNKFILTISSITFIDDVVVLVVPLQQPDPSHATTTN